MILIHRKLPVSLEVNTVALYTLLTLHSLGAFLILPWTTNKSMIFVWTDCRKDTGAIDMSTIKSILEKIVLKHNSWWSIIIESIIHYSEIPFIVYLKAVLKFSP